MTKPRIDAPFLTDKQIQRFWQRIDKSAAHGPKGDCWKWIDSTNSQGYGKFTVMNNRQSRALGSHRLSYYLVKKKWPNKDLLHSCHYPLCVNPNHLREGNQQDNMADRQKVGGYQRGSQHLKAKLNEEKVLSIRRKAHAGATHRALAVEFGVGKTAIGYAINGDTWRHI